MYNYYIPEVDDSSDGSEIFKRKKKSIKSPKQAKKGLSLNKTRDLFALNSGLRVVAANRIVVPNE